MKKPGDVPWIVDPTAKSMLIARDLVLEPVRSMTLLPYIRMVPVNVQMIRIVLDLTGIMYVMEAFAIGNARGLKNATEEVVMARRVPILPIVEAFLVVGFAMVQKPVDARLLVE